MNTTMITKAELEAQFKRLLAAIPEDSQFSGVLVLLPSPKGSHTMSHGLVGDLILAADMWKLQTALEMIQQGQRQ